MINGRSTSAWPRERRELFRQRMEQRGAMLAGGRLGTTLGISLGMKTTQHPAPLLPRHLPDHLPRGSPAGLRPFSHSFCPPSFLVTHTDWHGWDMCTLHPRPYCSQEMPRQGQAPSLTRIASSCGSLQATTACPTYFSFQELPRGP